MHFSYPAFLLLAVPGIFLWWRTSNGHLRSVQILRLILLFILLLALSQPTINHRSAGVDTLCVNGDFIASTGGWVDGSFHQIWLESGTHAVGIKGWDTGTVITAAY